MNRLFFLHALWLGLLFLSPCGQAGDRVPPPEAFMVINYHDIPDDVRSEPDRYSLDASKLAREFAWLHDQGYHPLSLEQIVTARETGLPLPTKAVLLTFDDGYASFYTRVFPLLKLFQFPAVLAIVGNWLETPEGQDVQYDAFKFSRSHFISWEQLREINASGLVEVASHSYNLHHGILANPQGNTQPAVTTRLYDPQTKNYETDAAHQQRIREDLKRNSDLLERRLGKRPRIVVWPYGRFNEEAIDIARSLGMPYTLTLEEGYNDPATPLSRMKRTIIELNPSLEDFAGEVRNLVPLDPVRAFHVELDAIYSPDPEVQEQNLSRLIERIAKTKLSRVYLHAVSDPDGDGVADALYFPNRYLPMRADLFNRAAWQIATRGGAQVFAWLPVSAFRLSPTSRFDNTGAFLHHDAIIGIYQDLARYASFAGILFDDRAGPIGNTPSANIDLTNEIMARCKYYRVPIKQARIVSFDQLLGSDSATGLAMLLPAYDQLVLPFRWSDQNDALPANRLDELLSRIRATPGAAEKVEFALQGVYEHAEDDESFAGFMAGFTLSGQRHFGFYPAEFGMASGKGQIIYPYFSLQAYPGSLPRATFRSSK